MVKSEPFVLPGNLTTTTVNALVTGAVSPNSTAGGNKANKSSSYFNSASSHSNHVSATGNDEDEDEDQIDWESEDDEIVKQEVEHFERNQVGLLIFILNSCSFFFLIDLLYSQLRIQLFV